MCLGHQLLSGKTGSLTTTPKESQACTPSSFSHCPMRAEHNDQAWLRWGEVVTCRLVWEPPAPILAWVVTAEQDLDAMGLGIDGFWGFLSTEGSQKFWTSFNLWGGRWRKRGSHQSTGGCCRDHLNTVSGVSEDSMRTCGIHSHFSWALPFTKWFHLRSPIYNLQWPRSGQGRLTILCLKMNI